MGKREKEAEAEPHHTGFAHKMRPSMNANANYNKPQDSKNPNGLL